jgi:dethiobiotin synthetase
MRGIFITGTDTGVGKTITSALLVSALKKAGKAPKYFKPVQTGLDDDTETLKSLTESPYIAPVYKFRDPISPNRAAALAHEEIDLKKIHKAAASAAIEEFLVVEGAGGLMVPLNQRENTRDLVVKLEVPLVIVASTRLGTINHTLLTLECARAKNINVKGIILVGPEDPGLAETLKDLGDIPILAEIPLIKISPKEIQSVQFFSTETLKQICGDQ